MKESTKLLAVARRYFIGLNHSIADHSDRPAFSVTLPYSNALLNLLFETDAAGRSLTLRVLWGFRCPSRCIPAMAMVVAQRNYGLRAGRFELDVATGDLYFVIGVPLAGGPIRSAVVHQIVNDGCDLMNAEIPGFMETIAHSDARFNVNEFRQIPRWRRTKARRDNEAARPGAFPYDTHHSPFPELEEGFPESPEWPGE